jgi:hypothetical protein
VAFFFAVRQRTTTLQALKRERPLAPEAEGQGTNDSKRILQSPLFGSFDEVHVFLQKHKWDFHAELRVDDIRRYLGRVPKVALHVVDADGAIPNGRDQARADATREQARHDQLLKKLRRIYP